MPNNKLLNYLQNIKDGKSINIKKFIDLAEKQYCSETQLRKILSWRKHKQNLYLVEVVDQNAFERLFQRHNFDRATNRVQASKQGDSHKKSVSGSLLTILPYQQDFPQVVLINKDGHYQTPYPPHKQLLIVENLENFLTLVHSPHLVSTWLDKAWPCDIVYAKGNAISNKLHKNFFSLYATIRCLLDIDLGGFTIYKNICALLPATTLCEFVFSQYYHTQFLKHGKKLSEKKYQLLLNFDYPPPLHALYHFIKDQQKFAEQEILIED